MEDGFPERLRRDGQVTHQGARAEPARGNLGSGAVLSGEPRVAPRFGLRPARGATRHGEPLAYQKDESLVGGLRYTDR